MSWLSQFFLNPGFVLPGAALASVPIIIHLLSRLRYKRVRFAAMEFLLKSDELNRRRLIIEQLLLLLLRVLAVVLIVLLLARLVLDPSSMMLLRGAKTHHVLIIDDSISMRETGDSGTRFEQATETLERMLTHAGTNTSSLQATVLTVSRPGRPLVTDRKLDSALIQELIPRIRNLKCSWRVATPVAALETARNVLSGGSGVAPQVHVLTDLRQHDWVGRPEVTEALKSLEAMNARVNLIQIAPKSAANVALTQMTTPTPATAVGVPWRLSLTFHNFSTARSSGLRATVYVDGNALPVKALLPDIEPNDDGHLAHDIVFEEPGQHEVEVRLEKDVLSEDNSRFVVVDVTDRRSVLIVDDDARQDDAGYVAAALGADQLDAAVHGSDVLVSEFLDQYDCIFLLNVREIPADATLMLAEYVRNGGGIAWFPGEQSNTTWYNTVLRSSETPLFPVQLGAVRSIPKPVDGKKPEFQIPVFEPHPVFEFYNDTPFADDIHVSSWFSVEPDNGANEESATGNRSADDFSADDVRVLAHLKNGSPIIFEHSYGTGRVLTFLVSAGKRWTNWPVLPAAPGYVVTNLLMHQYLQRKPDNTEVREIGSPVRFEWPVSQFLDSVEVFLPPGDGEATSSFLRLQAAPLSEDADADSDDETADEDERLGITLPQADRPGVYRVRRFRKEGQSSDKWLALSVSSGESDLAVADRNAVEQQSLSGHVRVISAETATELSSGDEDRELRRLILFALLAVMIGEQLLSLRLSYHPEAKS